MLYKYRLCNKSEKIQMIKGEKRNECKRSAD